MTPAFIVLMWVHVPVSAAIVRFPGSPAWMVGAMMTVFAGAATLTVLRRTGIVAHIAMGAMLLVAATPIAVSVIDLAQSGGTMLVVIAGGANALFDVTFAALAFRRAARQIDALVQANVQLTARLTRETADVSRLAATLATTEAQLSTVAAEHERVAAERTAATLRVDHLAHHDPVTGLANRALLMERLSALLAATDYTQHDVLVFYLDLADLKAVNETTGHASGDAALATIASRIRRCIRTGDTASRVGGDEFVIVCTAAKTVIESAAIAERLIWAIAEPIVAGSARMCLGSNIGISVAPADGCDADELIRFADAAMYRAKETGINTFHRYAPGTQAEIVERSTFRHELEGAIERDEFVVYYQPIMSLTSRAIIGAEALVRWMHPTRGLLAPAHFVPFAETHGLITAIGEIVMQKACVQIARFARLTTREFTMAVNVSAIQFRQPGFVERVCALLQAHDIATGCFEIEITESVIMDDAASVIERLRELDARGVRLSIDDFGTGYSSLSYVKNFPVHTLKIDRSFVNDVAESPTDQAIAATIITLAHNLGMRVVAEGIETREQLDRVRLLGADDVQGYLVSRPLPADDFERFVCTHPVLRLVA